MTDHRSRLLGVVHDRPGPSGFRSRPMARLEVDIVLDELAATDGPMSDDKVRRAYEARIRDRLTRGGGGGVMSDAAVAYRDRAARLDAHLRGCASCSAGVGCPDGDDTAEAEFRAWRAWEIEDNAAAREHRRRGFPW